MPALLQVVALAAMAFLASAVLGGDQRRNGPLSFYLLVGVVIGPLGIGLLDDRSERLLSPALSLAVTWLGWLSGMRLFDPRLPKPSGRVGLAATLRSAAIILAVMSMLHFIAGSPAVGASIPWRSGAAVGIALAASTYFAPHLRERLGEAWAPYRFLAEVSNINALAPILGLLALCLVLPAPHLALSLTSPSWASATGLVGLGLTLGLIFLLAAGRRAPLERGWLVLLGGSFLAAGVAGQLGLPAVVVGFVAGAVTTQSVGGRRLSDVVAASERPVALLLAVVVGIRLAPDLVLCLLAACAFVSWMLGQIFAVRLLGLRRSRDGVAGLAFLGYGGFPLAIAAQIDLSYGGWLGALTLSSAAAVCLGSDAIGALRLFAVVRQLRVPPSTEPAGG